MNAGIDGELVRKLRVVKSWSQEELAQIAGLSARTVQRIEAEGVGSLETRRALAAAFGLPPADLLDREPADGHSTRDPADDELSREAASEPFVERPSMGLGFGLFLLSTLWIVIIGFALSIALGAFAGKPWATIYGLFCLGGIVLHVYVFLAAMSTSYRITADRLSVRFGLQQRDYQWAEFESAFVSRGLLPFKLTFTPCTRLSHPVVLKRRYDRGSLELTPDNPEGFLRRVSALAPQLAQETAGR